ncbi:hypothetical protein Vretimale_17336 [Volvox reticuliferus]|uniref:Uncharacterized protein n=1 Tax=Volvox reticuliferus TaxID=1737510 RepID=A0A8J4GUY7_9CHLO|nr:hypothetical protein Vretifemale_83 [Volvox reticuliferus]GIM14384.1 hypothetical protein Vretimale_17336 [Volvox reticuliferus]
MPASCTHITMLSRRSFVDALPSARDRVPGVKGLRNPFSYNEPRGLRGRLPFASIRLSSRWRCHATSFPEADAKFARLEGARLSQQRSTDLLARLLESPNPHELARQHVEGLSEEFFMMGSAYLTLARKDGNPDVAARLERALTAAWSVKHSTLRPELQLLNNLVRAETEAERKQLYISGGPDLLSTLVMNDRWFATALGRMAADVERQPPNPGKAQLLSRLRAIQRETEALERQVTRLHHHGAGGTQQ